LRKCSNIVQKYYSKKFQKYQIFFFQKVFSNEISKKFKFCFKKNFKKGSEIIQKEISLKKIKKVYTMFFQKYFLQKHFQKNIFGKNFKKVSNTFPKKNVKKIAKKSCKFLFSKNISFKNILQKFQIFFSTEIYFEKIQ
jgi:hypothetical protein